MSDFLNDPKFNVEGAEQFKDAINGFFQDNKPQPKIPVKKKATPAKPKAPTVKLNLPEAPDQTDDEVAKGIELAMTEMDAIRMLFLAFQEKVQHLALYPYIFPNLEDFANACEEMTDMIIDNIHYESLTAQGKKDYEHLKKVRARILSSVYNKYKKEE